MKGRVGMWTSIRHKNKKRTGKEIETDKMNKMNRTGRVRTGRRKRIMNEGRENRNNERGTKREREREREDEVNGRSKGRGPSIHHSTTQAVKDGSASPLMCDGPKMKHAARPRKRKQAGDLKRYSIKTSICNKIIY